MKPHLKVEPEVCTALGKTEDEFAAMTLRQFFDLAYSHGYDVRQSKWYLSADSEGGLTVRMDREDRPILHIG